MSNIFDWVNETFSRPRMQSAPSVVDQGTYTYDPEVEKAAGILMPRDIPPSMPVPEPNTTAVPWQGIPASMPNPADGPPNYDPRENNYIPPMLDQTMPPDPSLFNTDVDQNGMGRDGGIIPQVDMDEVDENGMPLDPYGNHIDPNNPNGLPMDETFRGQVANPDGRGSAGMIPMVSGGINNDGTMAPTQTPHPGMPQPGQPAISDMKDSAPVKEPLSTLTDPVNPDDPMITPEEAEVTKKALEGVAPVNGVTGEDVAKVAAEDPQGFKKAMSWFSDMTGLTGKDLTRMAMFYAGSRIAGYDHSGSMSWAFETGMTMTGAREAMLQGLTKDGKYTTQSIEEFKKTNDRSKLKLVAEPNQVKTDFTSPKLSNDGRTYYKRTDKTGNTWYETTDGKRSDGQGLKDPTNPQTRIEMINDAAPRATSIVTAVMKGNGLGTSTKGKPDTPNWSIIPETAGPAAVEIILDMSPNIPDSDHLNSAMYTRVVQNAMEEAAKDARSGKQVSDIAPYVVAQLQYYNNDGQDNGWKQALMRKGEKLKTEEWFDVRNSVMGTFSKDPAYKALEEKYGSAELTNKIFGKAFEAFKTEVPLEKRNKDPNAFFSWLQRNIQ